MNPDEQKIIDRLIKSIEAAYSSPGRMFWRGFLWGLGRGVGSLIGFLLLLAVLYYLFKLSGLDEVSNRLFQQFTDLSNTLQALPRR